VLEGRQHASGDDHPETLKGMCLLAGVYLGKGDVTAAEPLLAKAVEVGRRRWGVAEPITQESLTSLAELRLAQHRYAEAEALLRESLAAQAPATAWQPYDRQSLLGLSLIEQERFADAESQLLAAYSGLEERKTGIPLPDRTSLQETVERIVQLYTRWGAPDKAAEWRIRLETEAGSK
jgi:eukaryotic-like serine/threonine-protein kinase